VDGVVDEVRRGRRAGRGVLSLVAFVKACHQELAMRAWQVPSDLLPSVCLVGWSPHCAPGFICFVAEPALSGAREGPGMMALLALIGALPEAKHRDVRHGRPC